MNTPESIDEIKDEIKDDNKHNNKNNNNPFNSKINDGKDSETLSEEDNNTKDTAEEKDIEENEDNIKEEDTEEENENETLRAQFDELNNKYIRLAADFDNFRKRTKTEKEELSQYTMVNILNKLTGVLDTFDRAQEHLKDIEECQVVKDSYDVAYKQLKEALKKIGLEEMDVLGKPFNPNEHEAISQIQTDEFEPDSVAVVMQKGYKLDNKVVRAALVGVAVKKETGKEE